MDYSTKVLMRLVSLTGRTIGYRWISGSKAELPCQRVIAGSALVSGGVHRIGMVACFISEICKRGVSRPKTDRFRLFSKALYEKAGILPAWET